MTENNHTCFHFLFFSNLKFMMEDLDDSIPDVATLGKRRFSVCDEGIDLEAETSKLKISPKSQEQKNLLKKSCRKILIFRYLSEPEMDQIADAMVVMKINKNERVIKQGFEGDWFYVVEKGSFEMIVIHSDGKKDIICRLNPGDYFGEIALMYGSLRPMTVKAVTDGVLWALDRFTFKKIVVRTAYQQRKIYESVLENVEEFSNLDINEKLRLTDSMIAKKFEDNEIVLQKGDVVDGIYIVLSPAQVSVHEDNRKFFVTVRTGEILGEGSFLNGSPRINTVRSVGPSEFAFLSKAALEVLKIGDGLREMKKSLLHKMDMRNGGVPIVLT